MDGTAWMSKKDEIISQPTSSKCGIQPKYTDPRINILTITLTCTGINTKRFKQRGKNWALSNVCNGNYQKWTSGFRVLSR